MATSIEAREKNGVLVTYFLETQIVDESTVQEIGAQLIRTSDYANQRMLINFTGVQLMSSAMIGKLLALKKVCDHSKIDLRFCSLSSMVNEVFQIMRLTKMFPIYGDEQEAIKSFHRRNLFR